QGYESHRFDIVIAAQVLHVTKNLGQALEHVRSLLAPGGFLLLWEATRTDLLYFDIYLPILQPFEEADELRRSDYPVLTKQQWYDALRQYGFVEVASFPKNHDDWEAHLLMAKASPTATVATLPAFTETLDQQTFHTLKKRPDIADWFYIPSWKRSALLPPNRYEENQVTSQHNWLVFVDEYGLGSDIVKQLEHEGQNVISVSVGPTWASRDDRTYTLNPQHSEDYDALLKALQARNTIPKTIVHCWRLTPQNDIQSGLDQLDKNQSLGFYSLLFLAQALAKHSITDTIQMNVVSNNMQNVTGHEVLCPEKATLIGPCRVIPQEYPNINCRSIDIVLDESGTPPSFLEQLLSECVAESSDAMIAYRNNERLVQTFKQVDLNEAPVSQSRVRKKGVYLITGGLGGIGLVLAEYLAKTVQAKLILTTHSFFPEKETWKTWLKTHDEQDSISRKLQKVQSLEALGAEVLIVNADIASYDEMSAAIAQSVKQFAQLHGVIQAAGVYPGGMIQSKTPALAKSILEPKVKGTLVLDAVLKDQPLDFMILCSSLAAIIGGTGLVDHCGANAFLDAFAHSKTAKPFTVSINWDSWQEIGQAAEEVEKQQKIMATGEVPSQRQYKKVRHPLFEECIVEGPNKTIYISRFSLSKYWFLDEHRFMGKPTLPGTAYLEMARAAFENEGNRGDNTAIEFKAVYFLAPLTIEADEEKEVQTILQKDKKGHLEFFISSQSKSGVWQEHARGQITHNRAFKSQTLYDIQVLAQKCQEPGQPKIQKALELGPRWNTLKQQIQFGPNQGLALIELPKSFTTDFSAYQLHPALLDAATGFSQAKFEGVYLPFSYQRLRLENKLPAKIYSYIRFEEQNSASKTLTFDIEIMDEQGRRLLEIENYTIRRVDADLD
ncbi:MAG: KR domain-containing protein, partial [Candidatus Parabeggiatoa sp.]|nr:KR domain-containing protein [Candidatus Parabeggiatoa sp.]